MGLWKQRKRNYREFDNVIDISKCKNCHRKLKEVRHNLHNEKGLFIGWRCKRCYKKFSNFIVGFLVYRHDREKLNGFIKAFHEQIPPIQRITRR